MKILLLSDSHGETDKVNKILNENNYDYLFFLGDGLNDIKHIINNKNVFAIRGNWDFFSKAPSELLVEINNIKFLLVHGNGYGIKAGLGTLIKHAENLTVDYVLFGHTHTSFYDKVNNITYINPGAIANTRNKKPCYATLQIEGNKSLFQLVEF